MKMFTTPALALSVMVAPSVGVAHASVVGLKPTVATGCKIGSPVAASDADRSLARGQFEKAARLFAVMAVSEGMVAGQVRALIGLHRYGAALAMASRGTIEHPQSALLADAIAAARLGRGEPADALAALRRSIALDPCLARAHYDLSIYLAISGSAGTGQKELETAHRLQPDDELIRRAWKATQEPAPTLDTDIADMRTLEARPGQTAEQRSRIESIIEALQADKRGDCEIVSSPAAEIALTPLFADGRNQPPTGSAIELSMNGKKRKLLVDTGATGLVLSFEAAKGLGLVSEARVTSSGVGDEGESSEFVAHIESLKIGSLELRNCKVRVTARAHGLAVEGLFGPDTLKALLVTLDFPHQRVRTAALPSVDRTGVRVGPGTIAESRNDRFVPAAMANWIPAFRQSDSLLVPVSLSGSPQTLFMLDTGAQTGLIARDVATEFTTVTARPNDTLIGVSGVTKNLGTTGPLSVAFAGYVGQSDQMTVLDDLTGFAPEGAMRTSGLIGYDVLRRLTLSIDYRDGLMQVTGAPR